MIAGGHTNTQSYIDSVTEYDIEANNYNLIQPLPIAMRTTTLVNKNGYMYSFGGYRGGYKKTVFRIELSLTDDWEELEDMDTAGDYLTVIPYN